MKLDIVAKNYTPSDKLIEVLQKNSIVLTSIFPMKQLRVSL